MALRRFGAPFQAYDLRHSWAVRAIHYPLSDGWDRMTQRYEASSDWGLTQCKGQLDRNGKCQGREIVYSSFPEALRAFLIDTGDIKPSGQP